MRERGGRRVQGSEGGREREKESWKEEGVGVEGQRGRGGERKEERVREMEGGIRS